MKPVAVKVSASGRLQPPAEVRKALGLKGPGHVVITVTDGHATLTTIAGNLARIRELARPYVPKDRLASEELIAERREEAKRESAEAASRSGPKSGQRPQGRQLSEAVLAVIWEEPGAERVEALLPGAKVSAVNVGRSRPSCAISACRRARSRPCWTDYRSTCVHMIWMPP